MADEVMTLEQVRDRLPAWVASDLDRVEMPTNELLRIRQSIQAAIIERETQRAELAQVRAKGVEWMDRAVIAENELAAAGAGKWQPISTAPKDGTEVLVWNKGCGHWVASYRFPTRGEPQNESHYVKEWRDGGGRWATLTLWQPLPKVPSMCHPANRASPENGGPSRIRT